MPRLLLPLFTTHRAVAPALAALAILSSSPAALADCPPGSWFCADVNDDKKVDDKKVDDKKVDDKKVDDKKSDGPAVQQGNTTIIVQTAPPPQAPPPQVEPAPIARPVPPPRTVYAPPPRYEPRPPPRRSYRQHSEWGFNMRLQGAMMDSKKQRAADEAGMGGLGFSLRARPTGHFALDFGLDFISGKDFNGYRRNEVPFTINAMLFVNPRDKTQLYFLGGIGWSSAQVETPAESLKYSYFGFQTGVGLEFRVARHVGLNVDLIGFIRGRTDERASWQPEFVDPDTGRATNTSGGGLFRGGLTVYWLAPRSRCPPRAPPPGGA